MATFEAVDLGYVRHPLGRDHQPKDWVEEVTAPCVTYYFDHDGDLYSDAADGNGRVHVGELAADALARLC